MQEALLNHLTRCANIEDIAFDRPFAVERRYIPVQLPHDCENLDLSFNAPPVTDTIGIFSPCRPGLPPP